MATLYCMCHPSVLSWVPFAVLSVADVLIGISRMIFSTPNSHSCHIGSFSDPVNTHWVSLRFFRWPNLKLFIMPEVFKHLAPLIDKMSRPRHSSNSNSVHAAVRDRLKHVLR